MGAMIFTVMAGLAQMELDIKRERINDSVTKRRAAGGDLGGRRRTITDERIRYAQTLIAKGNQRRRWRGNWECLEQRSTGAVEPSKLRCVGGP